MIYYRVFIEMSITDDENSIIDLTKINNYMLLLPELRGYRYTVTDTLTLYYIMDSEWKELDKHTKFRITMAQGFCY